MRRLERISLAASAATLWIDALLMRSGDAGPVGWVLSMAIPQLFVIPTALVALWATRQRAWRAAFLSGGVAFGQLFGPLGLCLGRPSVGAADLRVLTYNVGQFEELDNPERTLTAVAGTIRRLNPDVACLQEAHYHGRHQYGARLASAVPGYHAYPGEGLLLLSKRPLRRKEVQLFGSHYGGHWNVQEVAVDVAGREVRILNVHMVPDGYEPDWWPKRSFLQRIERKRQLRNEELSEILRRVEARSGPVVVCGDFNTQPFDPRHRRLAAVLTDAYAATHAGFGYTLTPQAPTKRVDYVWTRDIRPIRTQVEGAKTSDHRPLLAELGL